MSQELDVTFKLRLHPLLAWYGVRKKIRGPEGQPLWVEVPAGIQNATRLRLQGQGERRGNDAGDLYLEVQIDRSKTRLVLRGLFALVAVLLGCLIIWQALDTFVYLVALVLGCLLIAMGGLMGLGLLVSSGWFGLSYLDKRSAGVMLFLLLCGVPPLIINNFLIDIPFPWVAAYTCATLGGAVGGFLMYPNPMLAGAIGGLLAGDFALTAVYYYTQHRYSVWEYEVALVLLIGSLPGWGLGWGLKKWLLHSSGQ